MPAGFATRGDGPVQKVVAGMAAARTSHRESRLVNGGALELAEGLGACASRSNAPAQCHSFENFFQTAAPSVNAR